MSRDLNNNERFLKELADNHQPVPPLSVWDGIEQDLDKDKGKRRLFPFLWFFGFLLLGAAIFINLRGKKDKEFPTVEQEKIISDDQKQSDLNPSDIRTGDSEAINELILGQNANNSETILSDYQNQSDRNIRNIKSVDSETINEIKQGRNAKSSKTILANSENRVLKKVDSEKLESFANQQSQSNYLNTSIVDRTLEVNPNTINSNSNAIITKEDISTGMFSESSLEDRRIIQVPALQRLKLVGIPFERRIPLLDPSKNLTAIFSSESKSNASRATPWFLELGGGIGRNLSNPTLIDSTQGGFRLNSESKWYTWSTSLLLGYQFDNLWYSNIGFDLNQTKNKFDYWRREVSSLLVDENQNVQITTKDYFNIGEIKYTFVDLGLSIGKRISIDKWQLALEGGPILNVLFKANGKVQVEVFEFSRLEDEEEYFKTQIGIGARLSAMLDYPISDQLWISAGPAYHQYFNTISSYNNPLEERNTILQVRARLRYHF